MNIKQYIIDFADFPKAGIIFKDISPLLNSPEAMAYVSEQICQHFAKKSIDLIAGIESRGFIFASTLAQKLNKGMLMIRKQGKLPGPTLQRAYDIEYGKAVMEIQQDAIKANQNILIVDDLLATGGTAAAAEQLVIDLGGKVIGHAFIIELTELNGRSKLDTEDVFSLIHSR